MVVFVEMILLSPNIYLALINVFWHVYHTWLAYFWTGLAGVCTIPIEIIGLYLFKRVEQLNSTLDGKFKTWFRLQEIKSALKEHVDISTSVAMYNSFFKIIYLVGIAVGLPITLIWLHLLLFTDIGWKFRTFIAFSFFFVFIAIFHLQFNAAKISAHYRKSYKKLCKLQWDVNAVGETKISLKFKVSKLTKLFT